MKNIILAICAGSLLALFTPTSYACFCVVPDLPKAYEQATAVFVGEVVGIVPPRTSDEKAPPADRFYTIKFKVEKSWKGVSSLEISVLSGQGEGECLSYPAVHLGEKYLVYGDAVFPNGDSPKGQMLIDTCSRTALIPHQTRRPSNRFEFNREDGSQDIKALDRLMIFPGVFHRVTGESNPQPATYRGLTMGKSTHADMLRILGKPKWSETFSEQGPNSEVWYHYRSEDIPGDIVVNVDKARKVILRLLLHPKHLSKDDALKYFGNNPTTTRYEFCEGFPNGESAPLYETPTGQFLYLEYRNKGIALSIDDKGAVADITYMSEPMGASSQCKQRRDSAGFQRRRSSQ